MNKTVVKKVRLEPERARRLAALAEQHGTTESGVIRMGLELVERLQARREHIEELIALADGEEPAKVRFRLR